MATNKQANNELNRPTNPTQLGGDQNPATTPEDDSHDMSPIMANAAESRSNGDTNEASAQGSDFARQRQQGATGDGDNYGTTSRGQGMGHADTNGDEDRGYDQSGYRGGLGTSGGGEDLSDRNTATNQNPFVGGYDGSGTDQPTEDQTKTSARIPRSRPTTRPLALPLPKPAKPGRNASGRSLAAGLMGRG